MPANIECPEVECWHALFSDALPADRQEEYERHLESCAACRERLDRAEDWEGELVKLARKVGDPTAAPPDPTLTDVLERLHGVRSLRIASVEPADLYFLRPAEQPEILGTLGAYEVHEVIGQGGMGVVLKAFERALHRLVAIKVMAAAIAGSATARRRFTREAKAAAAVCHEHIVSVHGVFETDGLPYLVMQYVAGESLQTQLDRTGPLELLDIVRIGLQTASGLAAAHAQGLIHRDIKPANLLLENGLARVKITDFGLARMTDDVQLTQNGVVTGTPEYMAPEQARGEAVDHRADLFSLGSVLYAMCTGLPPFRAASTVAVLRQVNDQAPTPIQELNADVPTWLVTLIARLMAKNPADRFQSAAEVAELLEGYLAHLRQPMTVPSPELPPVPPGNSQARKPGRSQSYTRLFSTLAFVLSVIAALVFGLSYWFAAAGGPEPKEDARELYMPLRGIPENRDGWQLIGPDAKQCVKFEPEGLRITLPTGFAQERPGTGLRIPMPGHGDFEVTVHYEILTEPEQANVGQRPTKLTFEAQLDRRDWTVAAIARRVTSDKGTQFTTWTIRDNNDDSGTRQTKARQHAAKGKVGRLRIVRTGSEVSFYAAEGPDADFTLLPPPRECGVEDLKSIELVGSTGASKAALDVRFTDLRVRISNTVATPEAPTASSRRSLWILLSIMAVVLSVLPLGVWLLRRGQRDQPTEPDPEAAQLAPTVIAFRCPECAKGLKARAELAGKKIKCPGCGQAVRVLQTRPSVPPTG